MNNKINTTDIDKFYKAFEDRYRGSFSDIKNRMVFYIPILQEAGVGKTLGPVLDLGSGRCEWLDLLRDHSITAEGVDINPHSAKVGKDLGLTITVGDVFDFLGQTTSSYYGAITAFHVIEHIDWKDQLELIHKAYDALSPSGLLIIEWPNPENLHVSSQTFWLDPTHRRLVPWQLLSFMCEYCGFEKVEVKRFRPSELPSLPRRKNNTFFSRILKKFVSDQEHSSDIYLMPLLTAGQDIAIIAKKPG